MEGSWALPLRRRELFAIGALLALVALLMIPRGSSAGAEDAEGIGPTGVPLYDTMWELPSRATLAEADTYFGYLAGKGFDGTFVSLFSGPGRSAQQPNANGTSGFTILPDGTFDINAQYLAETWALLDIAHSYGLKVTVAPMWGNAHIHENGACVGINNGVLDAASAFSAGQQIAAGLAAHPAIDQWLYGGDNFCSGGVPEDVNIWRNLDAGINAGGGGAKPVGYHAPNGGDMWFATEGWLDFHAVQTSHCTQDGELGPEFAFLKTQTTKPIWAAEMRFEAMQPTFCTRPGDPGPGNPVTAQNVLNDATAALNAGLAGVVYGHNERWQYGFGAHGSGGMGFTSVVASFDAPGEALVLNLFGLQTYCYGNVVTVNMNLGQVPTNGNDVILGTPFDDLINGLGGDDIICAEAGNDVVIGGPGADMIFGSQGGDVIYGSGDDDTIDGGMEPDFIVGDGGSDTLRGGTDNDILYGGVGDDTIEGGDGFDQIFGDAGADILFGEGPGVLTGDADYLWGGPGQDAYEGNGGNDWLEGDDAGEDMGETMSGGPGDDIILGHGGPDGLNGGPGSDYLWGGLGLDEFHGGDGRDTLDGHDNGENLGEAMFGEGGDDIIVGWGGPDMLTGGPGSDYIWGGLGLDSYEGGDGPDYLDGNDGGEDLGETMLGGGGGDLLIGWGGDDLLNGGDADDYLWGGDGADTLNGDAGVGDICIDPQNGAFGGTCEVTGTV